MARNVSTSHHVPGFLARMARDTRGNTLAVMAAAMVPMVGLAGSAVDMTRLYVVRVRLQQACDAGVLAGRRLMTPGAETTLPAGARAQAQTFFANNFDAGWMSTENVSFVPSKTADQQVAGVAASDVPMTLMRFFNQPTKTVSVRCVARFDVADADIMFVLDTTGSMACTDQQNTSQCDTYVVTNTSRNATTGLWTVTENPAGSRIASLRTAVINFYNNVNALADPTTNFRFGFVPYSSTVNVGRLLRRDWISTTTAQYQSRTQLADVISGAATTATVTTITKEKDCSGATRNPLTGYLPADSSYTVATLSWVPASGLTAARCQRSTQRWLANFQYENVDTTSATPIQIANYVTLSGANEPDTSVPAYQTVDTPRMPLRPAGTPQATSRWQGCIEERATSSAVSFNTLAPPADLDPDLTPNSEATRWRPMWPEVQYSRIAAVSETSTLATRTHFTRYQYGGGATGTEAGYTYNQIACPRPAQLVAPMTLPDVQAYVAPAVFRPFGTTYHDIGMIWGARLLSPDGPFRASNQPPAGRNAPNRYIIFLTDGDMKPDPYSYSAYGMEQFDRRVTGAGAINTQLARHNTRFQAACDLARSKDIRIFVIAYAQALTPQLSYCGRAPGLAFTATNTATLQAAFDQIAQQVAMLRITQ